MPISQPPLIEVPFAESGLKNAIPANANNITGNAGFDLGFPPINLTAVAAGGIPPYGQDMNGILYAITECLRFSQAGSIYTYDAPFSTAIGGYRAGARVQRTDGTGYWLNTVDGNTNDPEASGAAAAGWVPDFTYGAAAITMNSSNVTLTESQYGKPFIVITGTLTANLNLIFPDLFGKWTVINSTTGAFSIVCKTASGLGVEAPQGGALNVFYDGSNISTQTVVSASVVGLSSNFKASATGTNSSVAISANEIVVESAANNYHTLRNVSLSPSIASSGANGLDTGVSVASTWYYMYVIWNGATVSALFSLSPTSPTMPVGYTHKALVGAIRTDSSVNKYPLSFTQYAREVRYKVVPGSNVTSLPVMASGAQGSFSVTAPTWAAVAVGNFVPTAISGVIHGTTANNANNAGAIDTAVAPNNNYSGVNTNNPPLVNSRSGSSQNSPFSFALESTNIYFVSSGAPGLLQCYGFTLNV